jgi:hypothetical protein
MAPNTNGFLSPGKKGSNGCAQTLPHILAKGIRSTSLHGIGDMQEMKQIYMSDSTGGSLSAALRLQNNTDHLNHASQHAASREQNQPLKHFNVSRSIQPN